MRTEDEQLDTEQFNTYLLSHLRGLVQKAKAYNARSAQTYKRYHDRAAKCTAKRP